MSMIGIAPDELLEAELASTERETKDTILKNIKNKLEHIIEQIEKQNRTSKAIMKMKHGNYDEEYHNEEGRIQGRLDVIKLLNDEKLDNYNDEY